MAKFWNFIKNQATDNQTESVELRIDGEIMSDDDSWIYEWFGIPCATPNAFRNELNQFKGKDVVVWINSPGGDVFAAAGIYNALKEHQGKVTVKIDGMAMSAASVIAMAADEILMSPVSVMMIHNPLTGAQGDANVMRKAADILDTVKETILNAYTSKTNRTVDEISVMMDEETWMSANTAIKEGFADGILYMETENNEKDTKVLNFAFNRLSIVNSSNESLKHLIEFQTTNKNYKSKVKNSGCQCGECSQTEEDCKCSDCNNCPSCCNNSSCCGCNCNDGKCSKSTVNNCKKSIINKGGKDMIIKNVGDLQNQLPEIHKEVFNNGSAEGIKAERERIKAFDVLNGKVDPEFLNEEKYKDGVTAESLLFRAMQEGKLVNSATNFLQNSYKDAANANNVPGSTSDNNSTDEEAGILNFVTDSVKKRIGNGGR